VIILIDNAQQPVEVFISYAHADEPLREELGKHLRGLERIGLVKCWHDRKLLPGSHFNDEIDEMYNKRPFNTNEYNSIH